MFLHDGLCKYERAQTVRALGKGCFKAGRGHLYCWQAPNSSPCASSVMPRLVCTFATRLLSAGICATCKHICD